MAGFKQPKPCVVCGPRNRVAWTKPRIDVCYACMPGGPITPPACRNCGADPAEYFSAGLCVECHPAGPRSVDSCRDCGAWGVIRKYKYLCWGCHSWRHNHEPGVCTVCGLQRHVRDDVCRRCWRQCAFVNMRTPGQPRPHVSMAEANRYGQQLDIANLYSGNADLRAPREPKRRKAAETAPEPFVPVQHRQPALFDLPRTLRLGEGNLLTPPIPEMAAWLDYVAVTHARQHGWSERVLKRARRGLVVIQCLQDTPGAPIKTSELAVLTQTEFPADGIIEICQAAGLVEHDKTPAPILWARRTIAHLPEPMHTEMQVWLDVMVNGSSTPPRRKARSFVTLHTHLTWAMPALNTFVETGHASLREVTNADVLAGLPPAGNPRATMGQGLRSIFQVLRGRRLVFTNPMKGIESTPYESAAPVPADLEAIRNGLNSPEPTRALLTALIAFHGLTSAEVRNMQVTDVYDGRLHLDGRTILLAEPVLDRLDTYFAYRSKRWPRTANQHLFLTQRTGPRTGPAGPNWLIITLGMKPTRIREDRILFESQASGGDLRRICDLFGLSISGAQRYLSIVDPPGFDNPDVA